jgi:queuine tRNA-ribosyltransferase
MQNKFRSTSGDISLPVFFPDATRAVIKTLDSEDIKNTFTPGILVNTYHLWQEMDKKTLDKFGGIRPFMNWKGGVISDSGGFQVMSVIKSGEVKGKITDEGVVIYPSKNKKIVLTPEKSIEFQMNLKTDMVVVLDDFTDPKATKSEAEDSVERTIKWAIRSKAEFEKICKKRKLVGKYRPYLLGVTQGGYFQDLRKSCTEELVKIGFDGLGYGGWPLNPDGTFDYESAKTIVENAPKDYLFYGLGIGKPNEIVELCKLGYSIFDCVLPTRDARHKRLYVYNAKTIEDININKNKFYSYYVPNKQIYLNDDSKVSSACDCLLCKNYSKAYLAHLFKTESISAMRLATIHNLRFYSLLMENIKKGLTKSI